MIHKERIRPLNNEPEKSGDYVLYWMQASQRAEFNHALEFAVEEANARKKPLVVFLGITDSFPEANERHYAFMLEGLQAVQRSHEERSIPLETRPVRKDSLKLEFDSFDLDDVDKALGRLNIDHSVGRVKTHIGGTGEAKKTLREFIRLRLSLYPERRNDPNADAVSHMSPYLRFGQISPLHIALEVLKAKGSAADAYAKKYEVNHG